MQIPKQNKNQSSMIIGIDSKFFYPDASQQHPPPQDNSFRQDDFMYNQPQ
jgi:hypothetical protein